MFMWLDEGSGMGYGVCSVANAMLQSMMAPKRYNAQTQRYDDDWPSVVAVKGPRSKYTPEELEALELFGAQMTARYDQAFRWRMGCNLIIIDKRSNGRWLAKRQSWDRGKMVWDSLEEARAIFTDGNG